MRRDPYRKVVLDLLACLSGNPGARLAHQGRLLTGFSYDANTGKIELRFGGSR